MKILIVDDDRTVRFYFREVCEVNGHDVMEAEDGGAALKAYGSYNPDLIISDVDMPYMSGLELLEIIRKEDHETIVIIVTSMSSQDVATKAMELGANNFLRKDACRSDLVPLLLKYESIARSISHRRQIEAMITERKMTFYLDNQLDGLPETVNKIMNETGSAISPIDKTSIQLGLIELLVNAIEHGNLGITYEEKTRAMENNTLRLLYHERMVQEKYHERKVKVEFHQDAVGYEWIITDQGEGFDWKDLIDPVDDASLYMTHGRGIFLAQFQFDEIEYIGKGNVVRAKKNY